MQGLIEEKLEELAKLKWPEDPSEYGEGQVVKTMEYSNVCTYYFLNTGDEIRLIVDISFHQTSCKLTIKDAFDREWVGFGDAMLINYQVGAVRRVTSAIGEALDRV